jgi:hypothetical protein
MNEARVCPDQTVRWVEVCYCPTPLQAATWQTWLTER